MRRELKLQTRRANNERIRIEQSPGVPFINKGSNTLGLNYQRRIGLSFKRNLINRARSRSKRCRGLLDVSSNFTSAAPGVSRYYINRSSENA